ncbi:anti-sigma factor domain-containing protein [Mangrovibacillus cuniculi]|uniref:RsgI N-terminal anti-sigma domain-containing protein n=1 Tax=Mangrovibacillus cuniculi TaxID=2593652 RepID=A0A7S8C9Y9_9BACI|nr:anti-sigma factor domain-containing protein [Mangrovibacillus cuniculi]QPC46124.1 hypothetical protein G8O30_03700 [Mangrovibacillus cuniculi]
MSKGIVVEIHSNHVVLLLPTGEFVNGERNEEFITLGDEIAYLPINIKKKKNPSSIIKSFMPVGAFVAAAAIMLLFFLPMFKSDAATMAYISLDINPSIELEVDENGYVKSLKPYNQDGEFIIEQLDSDLGTVPTVLSSIMEKSKQAGFIKEDKSIIISPVYVNGISTTLKESIMTNINRLKQGNIDIKVFVGSEEDRTVALEQSKTVAMVNREEISQKTKTDHNVLEEKNSTPIAKEEKVPVELDQAEKNEEKNVNTSISENPVQELKEYKNEQKNDKDNEMKQNKNDEKGKTEKKDLPEHARKGLEKAEEKRKGPPHEKFKGKKDKDDDDDDEDYDDDDDEEKSDDD